MSYESTVARHRRTVLFEITQIISPSERLLAKLPGILFRAGFPSILFRNDNGRAGGLHFSAVSVSFVWRRSSFEDKGCGVRLTSFHRGRVRMCRTWDGTSRPYPCRLFIYPDLTAHRRAPAYNIPLALLNGERHGRVEGDTNSSSTSSLVRKDQNAHHA